MKTAILLRGIMYKEGFINKKQKELSRYYNKKQKVDFLQSIESFLKFINNNDIDLYIYTYECEILNIIKEKLKKYIKKIKLYNFESNFINGIEPQIKFLHNMLDDFKNHYNDYDTIIISRYDVIYRKNMNELFKLCNLNKINIPCFKNKKMMYERTCDILHIIPKNLYLLFLNFVLKTKNISDLNNLLSIQENINFILKEEELYTDNELFFINRNMLKPLWIDINYLLENKKEINFNFLKNYGFIDNNNIGDFNKERFDKMYKINYLDYY